MIEQVERAWGVRIRDGFGQTETTVQIGQHARASRSSPARWAARCPGYPIVLVDPATGRAGATRARSASTSPGARSA